MTGPRTAPLRSVIVGYGRAGRGLHHRALSALFGQDHPVLIVDPRPVLDPLPGGHWVGSLADGMSYIQSSGVELAKVVFHVTTSPMMHLSCVEELVDRGARFIILEKPVASTLDEAYRIVELGRRATILPVSVWLSSRVTHFVEEILRSGQIGELCSLYMEQSKPRFRRTMEADSHRSAFEVELPHQMLLALWLAGASEEVLSVHSWPMEMLGRTLPSMGGAAVEMLHESGVKSTLITDLTAPLRLRRLRAVGSLGEIVADYPVSQDDDFGQVRVSGSTQRVVIPDAPLSRFVEEAYQHFSEQTPPPRGGLDLHLQSAELLERISGCANPVPTRRLELAW